MKMKKIRIVSNNIKFDILSRKSFQFNYFYLFLSDSSRQTTKPDFQNLRFFTFRFDDNETAAKLLCPPLIGSIEDESTVAANLEAISGPLAGRIVVISPCVKNLLLLINVSL